VTNLRPAGESRRLGDVLLDLGYITAAQIERALAYQAGTGARLGEALLRLGEITEDSLAQGIASQRRLPILPPGEILPDPRVARILGEPFVRLRQVLPLSIEEDALVLGMVDPLDVVTVDDVRMITGHDVSVVVITPSAFREALDYVFSRAGTLEGNRGQADVIPLRDLAEERRDAEKSSVVSLVDEILDSALKRRASDIHFEPQKGDLVVRIRVDGVMHELTQIPKALMGGVVSRLKIMGDMDIAEKRLPQDGRATYRSPDQSVDLRISSIPTIHGENVTVRLLDESMYSISLAELGMAPDQLAAFRTGLRCPHGQILITGPTGSGKSTTLYSALDEISRPEIKIYTVEDPVERRMPGILQTQVRPRIGLTFARALRSLVRSDPDVIMVGEIRDLETAVIATEAALTGHLVLSTLHTNDAPSAVTRLAEMGIPPYLIASGLHCVVAQRLVRRVCPYCSQGVDLPPEDMTAAERVYFEGSTVKVVQHGGCRRCYHTGYTGRVGVFEVLSLSREMRDLLRRQASADELRDVALAQGMIPLLHDGLEKVRAGLTTVGEIRRLTM
jgi:type IV pilus assembly protein PilB